MQPTNLVVMMAAYGRALTECEGELRSICDPEAVNHLAFSGEKPVYA